MNRTGPKQNEARQTGGMAPKLVAARQRKKDGDGDSCSNGSGVTQQDRRTSSIRTTVEAKTTEGVYNIFERISSEAHRLTHYNTSSTMTSAKFRPASGLARRLRESKSSLSTTATKYTSRYLQRISVGILKGFP
ncbi:histone H2B-like [Armigeres subalbatus]|uniref:histone H2B-like n=1 Tax=Armigeres subalbatus TaxID=124917 RepID=UPI002ED13A1B